MWRTVTGERTSGTRSSAEPASELSSRGLNCQESPLIGLLSALSRPAVSFLQRWSPLVPGHSLKQDLVEQHQREDFLQQLDVLPPQQLRPLPWFNLSELGLQDEQAPQDLPDLPDLPAQTLVSHVLLHPPGGVANTWLSGLWNAAEDERLRSAKEGLFAAAMDKAPPPGLLHLPPGLLHGLSLAAVVPDLDNGYSSLEEEQLQAAKAQLQTTSSSATNEEETAKKEEEQQEEEEQEEVPVLKCENRAIAFIMGCPCSDDSDDGDDAPDSDKDGDDGFDSVCSSDVSDDDEEVEEEEPEEEEQDSEAERLWSALCQTHDPYNPRNFTAKLSSAPQPIPNPAPEPGSAPSSVDSASSLDSSSSSSSWDEASETEQEAMKLLNAFCCSDPYSPLNFQASIRTKPGPETKPGPDPKPDSEGGRARTSSESSHSSSRPSRKKKQVRFQAEVAVFAVGCEERRGPWEELARDRARFAKRCSDVERVLSACLRPEHRGRVYLRISQWEESCHEPAGGRSSQSEERGGGAKDSVKEKRTFLAD